MVLSFCREAIKTEAKLSIAAFKIDFFSQQDKPLCHVASMTSSFSFECLLRRTAAGARKTKKLPLNAVSPSPPLSKYMSILLLTCYKRLAEVRGSTRVKQSFRLDCYGYLIP